MINDVEKPRQYLIAHILNNSHDKELKAKIRIYYYTLSELYIIVNQVDVVNAARRSEILKAQSLALGIY